jgi:hypothetical protein
MTTRLLVGDVFERMATLDDHSFDLIVTSPPFLALRSYLPDGHPDKAKEIGSEPTPADYLDTLLALTAEWRRLLAPHGSIAVELGDTYSGSGGAGGDYGDQGLRAGQAKFDGSGRRNRPADVAAGILAPTKRPGPDQRDDIEGWPLAKSLTLVPELYPACLAYGRNLLTGEPSPAGRWRIRNLKPWIRCLDIDTVVYVRTPTGDRPMRLLHLDQQFALGKFKLWNGTRWTEVVGTQTSTAEDAIELEFRTGERVACTRDHRWPIEAPGVGRKMLRADELTVGDVVPQTRLPDGALSEPTGLPNDDIGWLVGVFLGDGSFDSRDRIQIAGHRVLDASRADRLARIAADYDGTCSVYEHGNEDGGNRGNVVVRSKVLAAAIRRYIGGDNARNKHLTDAAWRRSDVFLRSLLMGYLESDGHYDEPNDRWRLGFTDNRWLARDLRTIAARLGASCIVRRWGPVAPDERGGSWAGATTFRHRGEIRFGHRGIDGRSQPKPRGEIVAIHQSKRRTFIDVAVADAPHLFALASGLLTHNSNPPVGALGDKERPATSYITVACVGASRWFDLDAVRTGLSEPGATRQLGGRKSPNGGDWTREAASGQNAGGAPPLDWWHHVDAVIDAEIDARAGKPAAKPAHSMDTDGARARVAQGGRPRLGPQEVGSVVGARGVHIRRALEAAGILRTVDAYDVSPKGYSGMTRPTTRLVPCGPHDGGQRTTSRGCPVHGDRPAPAPTALDDEHADSPATRTPHNSGRHVQGQLDDSAPTAPRTELTIELPNSDSLPQPCVPAATPHSTAANRTGPAPSTSPADMPSAEMTGRTAHTSTSPSLTEPDPGTPSSRTGVGGQPSPGSETDDDSARTSDPLAACTCSYHLAVKDEESTSHYAVWPPELVKLMISEMCPTRVCVQCGEPSRRLTETTNALGVAAGRRSWREGGTDGVGAGHVGEITVKVSSAPTAERVTVGWSDCGCGDRCTACGLHRRTHPNSACPQGFEPPGSTWRPGRILDPFVGSGTTLAVASGMGRDSVGIDLDERSADLARERVGMFLEVDYPSREVPA